MTALVVGVFALAYLGMALGRFPGLRIDRTGIALTAAIVLIAAGALSPEQAVDAIDFPTLFVLFGLMVLSAQYAASGFYDWVAWRIAAGAGTPERLLAVTVIVSGTLSAVLANDVVVFAMVPMLCHGLQRRGLAPQPFLIALAGAANAGSAATIIGNPQNILIAQAGDLGFWPFLAVCGVPALLGMACVHAVVWWRWRGRWWAAVPAGDGAGASPALAGWPLVKAIAATAGLLVLFATPIPQVTGVLIVAGAMLVSRSLASRTMLGMVDWHLLVLFAGLFVVTQALADTGLPAGVVDALARGGHLPDTLAVLAPLALVASNTIGNVPAVVLLLAAWPAPPEGALLGLAALSTLAGNLALPGSLANIIMAERAGALGVRVGLVEHARCGVPITLASMMLASGWLWMLGVLPAW